MTTTAVRATESGQVQSGAISYESTLEGSSLATEVSTHRYPGQWGDGGSFQLYLAFLEFDASAIPDGDTISAAVLSVKAFVDGGSYSDFTSTTPVIAVIPYDFGTVTTADWQDSPALAALNADPGIAASYNTANGWTENQVYDFVSTDLKDHVSKTGVTRLLLVSTRHIAGTQPSGGGEYAGFYGHGDATESNRPLLTVTHAAGASGANSRGLLLMGVG